MSNWQTESQSPEPQPQVLHILWTALLLSPFVMLGVLSFVRTSGGQEPSPGVEELRMPLLGLSGVLVAVAHLAGPLLEKFHRAQAHARQPPVSPLGLLLTITILRCALGEGAALFSAITWFLTGSPWALLPFFLALAAILRARPSDERQEEFQREFGPVR